MGDNILWAIGLGIGILVVLLIIVLVLPNPTAFQDRFFRVLLALAAAGIVAVIPGFINVDMNSTGIAVSAGGAIAVFVLVFVFTPKLMGQTQTLAQPLSMPADAGKYDVTKVQTAPSTPKVDCTKTVVNEIAPNSMKFKSNNQGPLCLGDPTYIARKVDKVLLQRAKNTGETFVIRGAAKMGRTSLLNRYIDASKKHNKLICLINLSELSPHFTSLSSLLTHLANSISQEFGLSGNKNIPIHDPFELRAFIEKEIFEQIETPVVIAIDEMDLIVGQTYQTEFFAMFRTWHNMRASTNSKWSDVDLVFVIAFDPVFLIQDANTSPFNVGIPIELTPLTLEETKQLNQAYGNLLNLPQVQLLYRKMNGSPYIMRLLLAYIADVANDVGDYEEFMNGTAEYDKVYAAHHQSLLAKIAKHDLKQAMQKVLNSQPNDDYDPVHRLIAMGLVRIKDDEYWPANEHYKRFLSEKL